MFPCLPRGTGGGILGTNYPEMDMVSFGPNIRGAHSPDECVQTVQKFWGFFGCTATYTE